MPAQLGRLERKLKWFVQVQLRFERFVVIHSNHGHLKKSVNFRLNQQRLRGTLLVGILSLVGMHVHASHGV